ncbi:MAG: hydroxylase, partial [Thermoanaerobaculia bacterium]
MKVQYLEIVTPDVDAVCATYANLHGVSFSEPEAGLG